MSYLQIEGCICQCFTYLPIYDGFFLYSPLTICYSGWQVEQTEQRKCVKLVKKWTDAGGFDGMKHEKGAYKKVSRLICLIEW